MKHAGRMFLFPAMLLGTAGALHAASFDCSRAKSPVEHVICGDKQLSEADSAMGTAYRAALAQLAPEGVSKLRTDQLRWLQWLQTACGVPGLPDPAEPQEGPRRSGARPKPAAVLAACMREPYTTRTALLKNSVARVEGVVFLARSMYLLQPDAQDDPFGKPRFDGFGEYEANWPEAQSNEAPWTAWNAAVLTTVQQGAWNDADLKRGEPEKTPHAPEWSMKLAQGVDSTVAMSMPKFRNGRIYTTMNTDGMGHGAAHPYEEFTKHTWLLKEQRWLRVSDVFRPGTPWQNTVAGECWRQLKKGENASALYGNITGPDDKAVQQVIVDVRNWSITPSGLRISWPEYSVAPRVAPQDDSVVPWSLVQSYMVEGFEP